MRFSLQHAPKILAIPVLLAGLAACGRAPDGPAQPRRGAQRPRTVAYSQGANDGRVYIANSATATGPAAERTAAMNAGIIAYLHSVNTLGGIDGRRVVFTHYLDDEVDPEKGREALRYMVEEEAVFAIVGQYGAPVISATLEDMKRYGIPAVFFASGLQDLYATNAKTNAEGYNLFPVQPVYQTEGRIMLGYAAGIFRAKTIGVVYTDDQVGMGIYQGVAEQAGGLQIRLLAQEAPADISNAADTGVGARLSEAIAALKAQDPDHIIIAALPSALPRIVAELAAQDLRKDCITVSINASKLVSDQIIPIIKGKFDVYGLGWVEKNDPQSMAEFSRWIENKYQPNDYAMYGWIAAHFFCEGLRRIEGEDITWENYLAAMERGPIGIPFGGSCDFSGGKRWGAQEMNLHRAIVADGSFPTGWEEVSPMASIGALLGRR
jgi:ABC-type branched-subunit amino acid transport system substrate-binding protein